MNQPTYNVVLLTRYHTLMATVDLRDRRLSDILNDEQHSALPLRDVRVARLTAPSKLLDQHPHAILNKEQIILAFETQARTQTAKRLYGYVKKVAHHVYLILDEVEVHGYIHTTGGLELPDIHRFIVTQREHFLPVTQAIINFSSDERFVIRQDSIIVNLQRLHYIAKIAEAPVAPPAPAPKETGTAAE